MAGNNDDDDEGGGWICGVEMCIASPTRFMNFVLRTLVAQHGWIVSGGGGGDEQQFCPSILFVCLMALGGIGWHRHSPPIDSDALLSIHYSQHPIEMNGPGESSSPSIAVHTTRPPRRASLVTMSVTSLPSLKNQFRILVGNARSPSSPTPT